MVSQHMEKLMGQIKIKLLESKALSFSLNTGKTTQTRTWSQGQGKSYATNFQLYTRLKIQLSPKNSPGRL